MADAETVWNLSNVAPRDWVEILRLEIHIDGLRSTNVECCEWLAMAGVTSNPSDISKLSSHTNSDDRLSPRLYEIVQAIIRGVSARAAIKYFEQLFHRSLKFFLPEGNPLKLPSSKVPSGLYEASRFSFSQPGKIVRSSFLFYRNRLNDEMLAGYADSNEYTLGARKASVCRFKEFRRIDNQEVGGFQILVGGFMFYNRDSFYLVGAAIETDLGIDERAMSASDIRQVYPVWYILDDDNDIEVVRGIKPTSLRNEGDPAAAVIELRRISSEGEGDWVNLSVDDRVQVGIFDAEEIDIDLERITPKISDSFSMLRVNRSK